MQLTHSLFSYLSLFLLLLVLNCQPSYSNKKPLKAVQGVLDLGSWDFDKDGPIQLAGQWEFHWNKFLHPQSKTKDIANNTIQENFPRYILVPKAWNDFQNNGKAVGSFGYASYRLQIKTNSKKSLALRFKKIATAYQVFVNGKFLAKVGLPGKTQQTSTPQYRSQVIDLPSIDAGKHMDLLLHISNFYHKKGGAWSNIDFGEKKQIHAIERRSLSFDLFLNGCFLIMGFYHLGLFLLRKKDRFTLYFGLFCLLMSLRSLLLEEISFYHLFPQVPFQWGLSIDYVTFYLGTPIFVL
ncbi:MAG: 7TM-DISM domain-containing protein, partial [Spirochaetota bacterium]